MSLPTPCPAKTAHVGRTYGVSRTIRVALKTRVVAKLAPTFWWSTPRGPKVFCGSAFSLALL